MTGAIWIGLAVLVVVVFISLLVSWNRTTGPSTRNETTPTQPPAGPGAEGQHVPAPGDITTGSTNDSDRQ